MPTLANRNNNPGNLRFIGQQGASQGEGGFARFSTPEEGFAALLNDVQAKITGKSRSGLKPTDTLVDFTKIYAPASDNNAPGAYAAAVANKMGVSPASTLQELQPRIGELAEAIAHHEGYQGQESASQGYNPKPFSQPTGGGFSFQQPGYNAPKPEQPQEPGLGQQLLGRTNEVGTAIQKGMSGEINPLSSGLQAVGAIGGAVGDVFQKGFELIPGVKKVEELLGQGVGALAKTPVGQSVIKSIQDFSTEHPELAGDIGATFNIVTAIPILRGLGAVKNLAMDSVATALKDSAAKGLAEDVASRLTVGAGKAGKVLASEGKGLIEQGAKDGIFPEIRNIGGELKYSGETATKTIYGKLDEIYTALNEKIKSATQGQVANMIPVSTLENEAKLLARESLENPEPLIKEIELLRSKYGDFVSIDQMNEAKQIVANRLTEAGFNNPRLSTDKLIRGLYQKTVEDMGEKLGIPGIHEINQNSRGLYKLLNIYEPGGLLDGKAVTPYTKEGMLVKLAKGTSLGRATENVKQLGSMKTFRESILKRSTKNYAKQSVKGTLGKVGLMAGAANLASKNKK